jgi:hypothetical protein
LQEVLALSMIQVSGGTWQVQFQLLLVYLMGRANHMTLKMLNISHLETLISGT